MAPLARRTAQMSRGRLGFVALVVATTWLGVEFSAPNFWFRDVAGIPLQYPALALLIAGLLPAVITTPRVSVIFRLKAAGLWSWTCLSWLVLIIALATAILTGAPELFADWRNLVVVALVLAVTTRWLSQKSWREEALLDLAVGYGLIGVVPLILWAFGGGVDQSGVRVPLSYGTALFLASYAAVLSVGQWSAGLGGFSRLYAFAVRVSAASSSLLILLSFRRSYWLLWSVAMSVLVYRLARSRTTRPRVVSAVASAIGLAVVTIAVLGTSNVSQRLESFLPDATGRFTNTNSDHVNDVLDALDVVSQEPLFGYGIGRFYETNRIVAWKPLSFEVHNALVHVWLKFGILGLIAYIGFHYRWITMNLRLAETSRRGMIFIATAIYLFAEFLARMFSPWPYGSFQLSIHHGVILAATLAMLGKPVIASLPPMHDKKPDLAAAT